MGVSVIDRFTYQTLEFMEGISQDSAATVADLVRRPEVIDCSCRGV